jgi:hypothetical protein
MEGFMLSEPPLTIVLDGDIPVGMGGVVPLAPRVGSIWLLGTDLMVASAKDLFLRQCHGWIDLFQKDYDVLTNVVHFRNKVHLRWLGWCGFEFLEHLEINGHPFIRFERRAHV